MENGINDEGHLEQSQFFRRIDRRRGPNDFGS